MCNSISKLRLLLGFFALVISCSMLPRQALAQSANFGDILVSIRSEPRGSTTHGYSEYVLTVKNRSEHAHTVTLVLPHEPPRASYEDIIRAVSRSVQVDENSTVQVPLLHPDYPPVVGSGLKVIIDGREQGMVPLTMTASRTPHAGHFRRGSYYAYAKKSLYGPETDPLILVSPRVGEKFRYDNPALPGSRYHGSPGWMVAGIGMADGLQRSLEPVGNWSPRWLSYSRYDGIVLLRNDLEALERGTADNQAVRTALFQYVESGGCLLVLGGDGSDNQPITHLPGHWKRNQETKSGVYVSQGGFGLCLQISDRDASTWPRETWELVTKSWSETGAPYSGERSLQDVNTSLPIVEDIALPVRGLFVLMLLFAIAIGPVNMWLLARWNRRIWLLWTVPVLSLITCLAVFGYMIVAEGWQGRTRVTAFTLLDEKEQRATTLGRSASYSPLTPSDGLHFSPDTEVTLVGMDGSTTAAVCEIDWTQDQHLRRGWMSARVPAHFQLRRSEVKRLERLPLSREADGSIHVTNQLGATISKLWLADAKGKVYSADKVNLGQRAALSSTGKTLPANPGGGKKRSLYVSTDWAKLGSSLNRTPETYLVPGTYLAVIESSPFLESGLVGAAMRSTDSYVLGLMADE